jgi:hypothetical protein
MVDESEELSQSLLWVYGDLLRIERHWTDQVQNQQRRIAAVLAVNGFLLAFLAAAGFQVTAKQESSWYLYPFYACLVLLTLALLFGVLTLFPQISIAGTSQSRGEWFRDHFWSKVPDEFAKTDFWLNSVAVWDGFNRSPYSSKHDLLVDLCKSVSANANGNLNLSQAQVRRRRWMNWQIAFIILSLILLVVSVFGWAVHVLTT